MCNSPVDNSLMSIGFFLVLILLCPHLGPNHSRIIMFKGFGREQNSNA